MALDFKYDKSEQVGDYIYFYSGNELIAVYNPFVGFCKKDSKSCYYECLVGVKPDKEECRSGGCETCDWYLVNPTPENCPVLKDNDVF